MIIFCFNEAGTIASVIHTAADFLKKINCTDSEIIIVDDGSRDGSKEIIEEEAKKHPNAKTVFHGRNSGIGRALLSGYSNCTKENVTAVPADGQFNLDELIPYANVQERTFISFFRKENTVYSLKRNFLSYLNKKINSIFLGIHLKDVNWVKIYKNSELKNLDLKMKSSLVESEICSKLIKRKNTVTEVHSSYLKRRSGVSKGASLKITLQAVRETLKLIFVILFYRK